MHALSWRQLIFLFRFGGGTEASHADGLPDFFGKQDVAEGYYGARLHIAVALFWEMPQNKRRPG
jgi:hypothetical protein